ncbi:MAG: DUF5123 domain-containing protein [Flavobacterium sp.]|nr:DUF5123 domain-containing protein [Flavobacterium sp.]
MKKNNLFKALLLLVGVLYLNSCSVETYPETRLFRPVLNQDLLPTNNTITVDMGKLKSAVYYKIEVSRDTFKTVLKSFDTPENKFVITDLLWNTLYQVRATAFAEKEEFNSKISDFGGVKTEKYPSILFLQSTNDVTDIAVRLRWAVVAGGQEVTTVKVFAGKDEELSTPLATYQTTPGEITAGQKIIPGLLPNTKYQLAIYSGATVRGWDLYTTKPPLTVVGTPIDLRNIPVTSSSLNNAYAAATNGQTIILDGDSEYKFNGNIVLNKSIVFKSGYTFSGGATLEMNNQFEVGSGTYSVVFDGVKLKGLTGSAQTSYIVNGGTTSTGTITDLKFLNCLMDNFRNLIRIRSNWGSGSLGTLTIDNSIVTNFGSAGMISTDNAVVTAPINNIVITNSTLFNIQKLIYLRNSNASSCAVRISDCTFYEAAKTAAMIEGTTAATIPNLQISNSIFGRGITSGSTTVTPPATVYDYALTKTVSAAPALVNNYNTNDFNFLAPIPSPITLFAGDAQALWVDPAKGNFRIKAINFVGKNTAGDPRWRP